MKIIFKSPVNLPISNEEINSSLNKYFEILLNANHIEKKETIISNKQNLIEKIIDCYVGSLKTRLGPAPKKDQRDLLYNIINFYVSKNVPINTFLTWGPKKFFAGVNEDEVDISELLSIERLIDINEKIKNIYSPGLLYIIYFEDFEGKFIEGNHLEKTFQGYIEGFKKIIEILNLEKIIKIIKASDWITNNFEVGKISSQLNENYKILREYWVESENKGIEQSDSLISYKKMNEIGWFGKIEDNTRNYYLGRLNNMLGDSKSLEKKKDMTIRLLSCVLMHRQFNIFKFNQNSDFVKLSFLKISGGPNKLMNGRIDIRTIPTNVSKKHISPWASNGCLRIKNNKILPCLRTSQEIIKNCSKSFKCNIEINNMNKNISLKVLYLKNN